MLGPRCQLRQLEMGTYRVSSVSNDDLVTLPLHLDWCGPFNSQLLLMFVYRRGTPIRLELLSDSYRE